MRVIQRLTTGPAGSDENHSVTIVWESGDYQTPDGFDHVDGMHRVSAKHTLSGRSFIRTRTFKGETAWSRAENLFDDIVFAVRTSREVRA
jgi:hypothetical protein